MRTAVSARARSILQRIRAFFQNFTSNTNVDVVLFWDKEAAAASFDYSGIVLSDSVASKVLSGSEYFDTSLKLGDTRYYAYLTPITGTDGKTAGALAVAIPVEHVKELYSGIVRSNTIFMYVLALIFCISTILVVRHDFQSTAWCGQQSGSGG